MYVWAFNLLFLTFAAAQGPPCGEYAVNDCTQDPDAEVIAFNTGSQQKCQLHCEIEEDCQFYSYHKNPSQNVDCHLFREPFSVYVGHCDVRTGPLSDDVPAKCENSPDENSCQIEQHENCNLWGKRLESDLKSPDVSTCQALCKVNQGEGCRYWEWSREKGTCNLYDSADKQCNIAFGPSDGAPGDCGATPTEKPTEIPPTAKPGTCEITCPSVGLQLFEDCDNCGGYYECYNGVLSSPKICQNCFFFDEAKGYCNQQTQVDCGERPDDVPCNEGTKPGNCPYDDGYFKDVHNCGGYFICSNGVPSAVSCSNSTFSGLYDYTLEWCNFPVKVDCEERPICTGEAPEYKDCQCQGAETVTDFACPASQNVEVFVDPYNCQHLIVCQGGAMVQEAFCEDGMYGNEQTGTCVKDEESVCGGRPICRQKEQSKDCYCAN